MDYQRCRSCTKNLRDRCLAILSPTYPCLELAGELAAKLLPPPLFLPLLEQFDTPCHALDRFRSIRLIIENDYFIQADQGCVHLSFWLWREHKKRNVYFILIRLAPVSWIVC